VVERADITGMGAASIWLPPGVWIEAGTHAVLRSGGQWLAKRFHLEEIPYFVKGGAIITSSPVGGPIGQANRQYSAIQINVFPGANSGSASLYEDDGMTTAYVSSGGFAYTRISYTRDLGQITVRVTTEGSFVGILNTRRYILRLVNSQPPSSVTINGVSMPFSLFPKDNSWRYEGSDVSVLVESGAVALSAVTTFVVTFDSPLSDDALSGIAGGIRHAMFAKDVLDETWGTPGSADTNRKSLLIIASMGEALGYLAGTDRPAAVSLLRNFGASFAAAVDEVRSATKLDPARQAKAIALLQNALN